ncbi:MAG: hypothetical protein KJ635_05225 [Proteobacteria bacterium]|nr:hypothetical protein [Pseudomonadota bacterium]
MKCRDQRSEIRDRRSEIGGRRSEVGDQRFRGSEVQRSRALHNTSIVIASEAKQSRNLLIIHKIATFRHALLAAKGSLAPRNDQN